MGKLKTKKTLSKRIKITSKGKILRKKIRTSHLKAKLNVKQKGRKNNKVSLGTAQEKVLKNMLPKV